MTGQKLCLCVNQESRMALFISPRLVILHAQTY